jgi:hypothetical protein
MGTNLYNVYEDDDFYRFFNGFKDEIYNFSYERELDASNWWRTTDYYRDIAAIFYRYFEHFKI